MTKTHFDFKQFTVFHDRCAMKVGTDGVLLGAWTQIETDMKDILDIGTGSGLIAIMIAQKSQADIIGIDIDKEAIEQAKENGKRTFWSSRLHFEQADAVSYMPDRKFDLIISNPPFYPADLPCPERQRNYARHTHALPLDILVSNVVKWLNPDGVFNVILPATTAESFIQSAWERGLNLYRICEISTIAGKSAKRLLLSFKNGFALYPVRQYLALRDENGCYSEEYKKVTEDYYLW